jgi:hypothetical protein
MFLIDNIIAIRKQPIVVAGHSVCRLFDGAGVLHQLSKFHLPAINLSKVGDKMTFSRISIRRAVRLNGEGVPYQRTEYHLPKTIH